MLAGKEFKNTDVVGTTKKKPVEEIRVSRSIIRRRPAERKRVKVIEIRPEKPKKPINKITEQPDPITEVIDKMHEFADIPLQSSVEKDSIRNIYGRWYRHNRCWKHNKRARKNWMRHPHRLELPKNAPNMKVIEVDQSMTKGKGWLSEIQERPKKWELSSY
jgi:hypothetical protein